MSSKEYYIGSDETEFESVHYTRAPLIIIKKLHNFLHMKRDEDEFYITL